MEIAFHTSRPLSFTNFSWFKCKFPESLDLHPRLSLKLQGIQRKNASSITSSLTETAVSVAVAATVVGAAATILVKRTKASEELEVPEKTCEDCGGTGICPECKGEGFVLKRLSDESAERARLTAKNMATRYTAGLPKKWSYCTKCSSSRACIICDGRGKLKI
ncbi:hypothetical protein SAY87_019525 [Trapa incisa]|uniref:DUF7895 domain-containing protein n=2 Tax=Trapa TaxID=22665 RepID=A0AAN7LQ07_TRANT|nr:hypothetical protein SAY87_019525 [Trapa incisa]KAK4793048.1 hypothetical protein SAY86_023483 [Trapa natans]